MEALPMNSQNSLKERIQKVAREIRKGLKVREKKVITFIKRNRTKVFLEFFRKNSGALVVFLAATAVSAGNLNADRRDGSFLFGFFQEKTSNEEIIQRRVLSHAFDKKLKGNPALAPLEIASAAAEEEDIQQLMVKDGNLSQIQMQYQVLSAVPSPDAKKLLEGGADVAVYEVKQGDTVSSIAKEFGITTNTILWANDLDDPDMIQPGDKIFILPVTGVKHIVKTGETLDKIAKKYQADKEKIITFNELPANGAIKEGEELIIPDGKIKTVRPTTPSNLLPQRNYYSSGVAATGGASATRRKPSIIDRNPKGGHKFPYGYCTWYVAQHKYVPWGGNAGTWLYHARAYGAKTGKVPKVGAIIVTSESWYGHVGIVTKVKNGKVTIKEMNYRGWAKVSTRTISTKSRVIRGYIY